MKLLMHELSLLQQNLVHEVAVCLLFAYFRKFSVSKYDKSVKEVVTEKIQKEFLTMEEQEVGSSRYAPTYCDVYIII